MMRITGLYRARLLSGTLLTALVLAGAAPAAAQTGEPVAADATPPADAPSDSAMVNLVRMLVKQRVLKADAGEALMRQAEAEAAQARAAKAPAPEMPAAAAGAIRVPYIPESVRAAIRDEIRSDVMREAKADGWASPEQAAPDWTRRVTLYGDVRVRSQSDLYARTNSNLILDFNRINLAAPYAFESGDVFVPFLNSREDRWNRTRLRARLGAKVMVTQDVTLDLRLATGEDNSPISTNNLLGGGFGKRDIWLDRASMTIGGVPGLHATLGRMANPFSTPDLLFDDDLNFDGVALVGDLGVMTGGVFPLTLRGGAFPLDYGLADYPVLNPNKSKSVDRYLFAVEAAAKATVAQNIELTTTLGYYNFTNIQGRLSELCDLRVSITCSTDQYQPFFLRKGNTLSKLRNLTTAGLTSSQLEQIPGLTFDYDVLNFNASARMPVMDDVDVTLTGNYIKNLAFKRRVICANGQAGQPVNNGVAVTGGSTTDFCGVGTPLNFVGGNEGYGISAKLGHAKVHKQGSWSLMAGYRYLESDATLDAFTDSDFHLGGTNAKGYVIGGKYGLFDGLALGARWLSANEIAGDPFAIDVLQVDLEVSF